MPMPASLELWLSFFAVDSFPCRHHLQSFVKSSQWLYEKCYKSPKMPYSAMVREVEKLSGTGSPPVCLLASTIVTPSFNYIGGLLLQKSCSPTDTKTHKQDRLCNLPPTLSAEVIKHINHWWLERNGVLARSCLHSLVCSMHCISDQYLYFFY